GVGKTRLALHVASTVLPNFEDGVWFVPLAPLTDPTQVLPAIAQTLDLQQAQREVLETLVTYLRRRKTLLVLDNFEHVGEAALGVADLLAACHQLTVLVTSREALRLYGEYEFDIFPLPVPPRTPLPALADLAGYAAVDLFVQRAQAVSPSFRLTAHNAVTVADACVWLDGLPLAIELAATRVKDLASQEARTQSVAHFQQIQRELRDLPERQRSLRSAIAWSYDLLNTDEQALLRRLSVFAGGCTSAAVEAVFSGEDAVSASVTAILSSLVEKHLVYQEISADGEPRFLLLETIREFALAQLQKHGEEDAARQAHIAYFLAQSEKMADAHHTKEEITWLHRLEHDHDNLRAALRYTLQTAQTCTALQFGRTLRRFWYLRGYYREGESWLAQIMALPSGDRYEPEWTEVLLSAGALAAAKGDYVQAAHFYTRSLAGARKIDDPRLLGYALCGLGFAVYVLGDHNEARRLIEEGLQIRRDLGDQHGVADALHVLGVMTRQRGDHAAAQAFLREEIVICREIGDTPGMVTATRNLAISLREKGDFQEAKALFAENMRYARSVNDRYELANCLLSLGHIHYLEGNLASARDLYRESLDLNEQIDNQIGMADGHRYLGVLAWAEDNLEEASAHWGRDLQLRQSGSQKLGVVTTLANFVGLAAKLNNAPLAVGLAAAVTAYQEELQLRTLPRVEKSVFDAGLALAKTALAPDALSVAWAQGQSMTIVEACSRALALA
ncbi:MAG: tetratricopeptide repeat protein, partial [Caldilineaceae bacterium]|nr:tetratricopeptide repeat protein [Caldilineaceae bacterium]